MRKLPSWKAIGAGLSLALVLWGGLVWQWAPGSSWGPCLVVTGTYGAFVVLQFGVRDLTARYLAWVFAILGGVAAATVAFNGGSEGTVIAIEMTGIVLGGLWAAAHQGNGTETGSTARVEPQLTSRKAADAEIPLGIRAFQVGGDSFVPCAGTTTAHGLIIGGGGPGASPDLVAGVEEAVETLSGLSRDWALPEMLSLHKVIRDGLSSRMASPHMADALAAALVPLVRNWRDTHDADWRGKLEAAEGLVTMWRDEAHRMRRERDESRNLASIGIPKEVSRETLDRVREVFETAPPGPVVILPNVDEKRARAVDELAARVTPELLALPIPTDARSILEELRAVCSDERPPAADVEAWDGE